MHNRLLSVCLLLNYFAHYARADFMSDMEAASGKIRPVLQQVQPLVAEGRIDEANAKVLATFPASSRTAVQAFTLGNVLFKQDPKTSYELHKRAAAELAEESAPQLEWALEQHRAGEWAGAAETYAKYVKAKPQFAPAYGLMAECLIRTNKIREAVAAWQQSERAAQGSLEEFESMVCEVHKHSLPDHDRAGFWSKAKAGDVAAAEKLIALDADFPRDWWNGGPNENYLSKDMEMLRAAKFTDAARLNEILTAADCAVMSAKENGDVRALLRQRKFLFDDQNTLPQSGAMLSAMLGAAIDRNAISKPAARIRWGPAILAKAKSTRDPQMFNAAAYLYVGTDQLAEIDQLGWDATGDQRFGASLIVGLATKGTLGLEDQRLTKISAAFPENAEIARVLVALNSKASKPMQLVLIQAIKSEYAHFSIRPGVISRPAATALRAYFAALAKELPPQ